MRDDGSICGLKDTKKRLEDLPNKTVNSLGITVSVALQEIENKNVIVIIVAKSKFPVSYQSRFYIRSGSTTQELKGAELQNFILKANNTNWDEVTMPDLSFDVIDTNAVRLFIHRAILHNRMPADADTGDIKGLFHNLELTNDAGELTRAALLLFGKQPTRYFKSATFKIGRFGKNDTTDLLFHDLIEGNIFQMPDRVMDFLKSKYLIALNSYEGLQRVETLEIPESAMREAILNAIIHRDYQSVASVELRVSDTMLSVWNPGTVMPPLTVEMLKHKHDSYPRNSLIAKIFFRSGAIEAWGRGTVNIIRETEESGLIAPKFSEFSRGILVEFHRNEEEDGVKSNENTTQTPHKHHKNTTKYT
jgi:ATP-dependent DNA helicase RecG